jgi:hypothetical protein
MFEQDKKEFIEGVWYDRTLIIFTPFIALLFVISIVPMREAGDSFLNPPHTPSWLLYLASILIFMHVALVFVRSHLNSNVFSKYKLRFTLFPLLIFLALAVSPNLIILVIPFSLIWDEIHSAMQTFGFGRIYDSKLGNSPLVGRKYDMILCFFIEYYPHITRMTILPYKEFTQELDVFGSYTSSIFKISPMLTVPMIIIGVAYILFYIYKYTKLVKAGYKVSSNKLILFATTGGVTIFTVWNYSIMEALIIGNIYHSVQYFAIVWVSERKNLIEKFNLNGELISKAIVLVCVGVGIFLLSYTRLKTEVMTFDFTNNLPILASFWLTTSLMHFWYDGFIWSVRRKDV